MRRIWHHLTYANVMATVAVFVAVGGGTAFALAGHNTVFSDDVVNGQVKTPDLRDGAVSNAKLAAGAVTAAKVAPNSLGGGQINEASLGAVPNAETVNGIDQQLIRTSKPSGSGETTVGTFDGLIVRFDCTGGDGVVSFSASGANDYGRWAGIVDNVSDDTVRGQFTNTVFTGQAVPAGDAAFIGTATLRRSSGRIVRFDFQLLTRTNGFGTTDDCFLDGFIRSGI